MAGAPGGFNDFLAQKYNIQQQEATARGNLFNAEASAVPITTASEARLRGAQSSELNAQAQEVAPNAAAQRGLTGAQTFGENARTSGQYLQNRTTAALLRPIGSLGSLGARLYNELMSSAGNGGALGNPSSSIPSSSIPSAGGLPINGGSGGDTGGLSLDQERQAARDQGWSLPDGLSLKRGTANVPAKGKGPPPKGHAQAMQRQQQIAAGSGTPPPPKMPGKGGGAGLAALLPALMAAGGGAGAGGPQASPPGGAPPMAPGGALGFFGGTTQVPGKGSGKVDKVPAMLAPHEAVLNRAAADMMGRGKIAALNNAGAAKMGMGRGLVRKQA